MLTCHRLRKTFGHGRAAQSALHEVTTNFHRGETCALLGPSGSGKTTLLSILGCLLSPDEGELTIDGTAVNFRSPGTLANLRRQRIGFVFQHAQLLPFLTIEDNLRIVGENAGLGRSTLRSRISELLQSLGIADLRQRSPESASGGERQRVAIARALLHSPSILLADEPTASLDAANGDNVVRLLIDQAKQHNALLIVVTHDTRVIPRFDRVLHIDSGKVREP